MPRRYLTNLFYPILLFLLNAYLCHELFGLEYSKFLRSIEGAFISVSRYAMQNWNDLTWFNLWYGGIPYQNTYPPLLNSIVAVTAQVARISAAHAYHLVTAVLYCLGPVSLYWLAVRLSGSRTAGFCAGLFYTLIAPSAFLMASVRDDLGSPLGPRRLQALVTYGEGPHVAALMLLPLALLCLDLALSRRKPVFSVLAAVSMAVVVLTNWLAAVALALGAISYLLAHPRIRIWLSASGIAVLAYLFVGPWIPPSTIRAVSFNAQTVGGDYTRIYQSLPKYIVVGIVSLLVLKIVMHRWKVPVILQFTWFYALLTASITLCAEWWQIPIVPQPERYHLEMDQALVLAVFCTASVVIGKSAVRIPNWARAATALLLLMACYSQIHRLRHVARDWIQPVAIKATTEYKIADWFEHNMNGARVMAPGSPSYWMNIFTNTPQLGGGFENGVTNRQDVVAQYIICSGDGAGEKDAEIAVLWLRAFGVQAIAVAGPHSGEGYDKPFRNPDKFEGVLPIAWREGEDRIYRVPQRSTSIAHVVRPADLVSRPPVNGLDVELIRKYVAALEDRSLPAADLRWKTRHSVEIISNMQPDQIVSVQESYHPGWHAAVNGAERGMFSDSLGFMAIEPKCDGACTIELTYDGGVEMRVAKWLSGLSLAASIIWIVAGLVKTAP